MVDALAVPGWPSSAVTSERRPPPDQERAYVASSAMSERL